MQPNDILDLSQIKIKPKEASKIMGGRLDNSDLDVSGRDRAEIDSDADDE